MLTVGETVLPSEEHIDWIPKNQMVGTETYIQEHSTN